MKEIAISCKDSFSQLAALANGAIYEVPELLKEVEISLPFCKTPKAVEDLFEYCEDLLKEMKKIHISC